jgi:hypothetical protein
MIMVFDYPLLSDYPIMFNGTSVPWPSKWEEDDGVIEVVNQTESGMDVVDVVRNGKKEFSATFKCTHEWLQFFVQCRDNDVTLKIYDPYTDGYVEYRTRMRNLKVKLKKGSHKVRGSKGIWDVSFDLIMY